MKIKVVVACTNAGGGSDLFPVVVDCSLKQYDDGLHYSAAGDEAAGEGYEEPFVCFDENDGPKWLFENMRWRGLKPAKA